jgi:hypothetical protein
LRERLAESTRWPQPSMSVPGARAGHVDDGSFG